MLNFTIPFIEFFKREVPDLENTYHWSIPTIEGFFSNNGNNYLTNTHLKKFLHEQWINAQSNDEKIRIANIIVNDWGGVRSNKADTIARYVRHIEQNKPLTTITGVASYSKILSIVKPDTFSIYDARVAACLNALQINAQLNNGICFNYIPGRNNTVGNATNGKGFTQADRFSRRILAAKGWKIMKRDDTYRHYNDLLSTCLVALPDYSRINLEMALFANAETECQKAIDSDF